MQYDTQPSPRAQMGNRLSVWLATGLGLGMVVPAPGTLAGGLWGLPLAYGVVLLPQLGAQLFAVVALCVVGLLVCLRAVEQFAETDPQPIVLDEIFCLSIVFLGVYQPTLSVFIAGFLLFRLFDILKPGPCRWAERLPGGLGVMADDVVAGLMGWAVLHGLLWIDAKLGWDWFATGL